MLITTAKGYIPRDELKVEFSITEEPNNFIVHCIWMHNDELVRKDVWVNSKNGFEVKTEQGHIGG